METSVVRVEVPEGCNVILGMSHFIKTVEDIYETLITSVPNIRFGLAFCEGSGPRLVRFEGTDIELVDIAKRNALAIGCGHSFIVYLRGSYPINVLNRIKMVQEVCQILAATANPLQAIVVETDQGRGLIGVIDGEKTLGIETEEDKKKRRNFLRDIGYKMG